MQFGPLLHLLNRVPLTLHYQAPAATETMNIENETTRQD